MFAAFLCVFWVNEQYVPNMIKYLSMCGVRLLLKKQNCALFLMS